MLQLREFRSPCHDLQVGSPDLQMFHRKTSLPPMQEQQTTDTQMCKLRTGARHYKSPLPKENGSREESKDRTSVTTNHSNSKKRAPIQLANAWDTFTEQEVEKRNFSCQPSIPITTPATIKQTMEVSTKQSKPTARNQKQCRTKSQK